MTTLFVIVEERKSCEKSEPLGRALLPSPGSEIGYFRRYRSK